jgi:hypothetical protein
VDGLPQLVVGQKVKGMKVSAESQERKECGLTVQGNYRKANDEMGW